MAGTEDLEQAARRIVAALRAGEGLSVETAQELFTAGVTAYAARRLAGNSGSPLTQGHAATATDVAITTTAMLEDVNIAIFELGLWQSMGGKK
ncbi:MAG: hypothetical protein JWQ89_699 [Devosia sp.]|uniref:hypothetical protein n=1 Tax=Devosia sp. TaxID=1871048 RepID=UPI002617649F|nr:hypothetical protein [Devosia sp.]MDB5538972.1 hypothetical protein [Devosia sp.]